MKKLSKSLGLIIAIIAVIKNLPKLKVSHGYKKLKVLALHAWAHATKFSGDSLCGSPDVADATIYTYADNMLAAFNAWLASPTKALNAAVKSARKILLTAIDLNANYLEGKANGASIAAGDSTVGINVIERIGFQVAGRGIIQRIIGVVSTGIGWFHAHEAKTVKYLEGHIWEAGTTPTKGVPPVTIKTWFTLSCDCIFYNIPSGTIIGYRHASILPAGHKSTPTGLPVVPKTPALKGASLLPTSKSKHPMIDFENASPYTFGGWRYIVVP